MHSTQSAQTFTAAIRPAYKAEDQLAAPNLAANSKIKRDAARSKLGCPQRLRRPRPAAGPPPFIQGKAVPSAGPALWRRVTMMPNANDPTIDVDQKTSAMKPA